jgi:hypothetical protein
MKETTRQVLSETQRINSETVKASKASGFRESNYSQEFPFGDGSREFQKLRGEQGETVPTSDHEFMGFKLTCMKQEPWHWSITPPEGMEHPKELQGYFTRVEVCEEAIKNWLSRSPTAKAF